MNTKHLTYLDSLRGIACVVVVVMHTMMYIYPNFKEDNPSKIVSGFGGTLCLVLSFLYIVASVVLLAIGSPWGQVGATPVKLMVGSWIGFGLFAIALGWVPYKLGLRQVVNFES